MRSTRFQDSPPSVCIRNYGGQRAFPIRTCWINSSCLPVSGTTSTSSDRRIMIRNGSGIKDKEQIERFWGDKSLIRGAPSQYVIFPLRGIICDSSLFAITFAKENTRCGKNTAIREHIIVQSTVFGYLVQNITLT